MAPIIAAFIAGAIAALIAYYLTSKRKALKILIGESEDLTSSLREHHKQIAFKVEGKDIGNLNRALVAVKNDGNAAIAKIRMTIVVPLTHELCLADVDAETIDLSKSIEITAPVETVDPYFELSAPYLNPKEGFAVEILFDGKCETCKVHCRMEDVKVIIEQGDSFVVYFGDRLRTILWRSLLKSLGGGGML